MKTQQTEFWNGSFGKDYTDRNTYNDSSFDELYIKNYGVTKIDMSADCMRDIDKNARILEVGCNIGLQLRGYQRAGYNNLYGIELQQYAVNKAYKHLTESKGINIIQGSGFDIPFKDQFFDVVCTNGVLIHISPDDYTKIMSEMYRCSSKYIMGFEYYADQITEVPYRGNTGYLWKTDFAAEFIKRFPDLKNVYTKKYPYISPQEKGNVDYMYLLKKTK